MVIDIKMCRFENVPWGFRLVGGSDFEFPLTVVKVTEGSIADEAGMREGDIIVRLNDTATSPLTHEQADQLIRHCGNVFYFGIYREESEEEKPQFFPISQTEYAVSTPHSNFQTPRTSSRSPTGSLGESALGEEYLPELPDRPCSVMSENTEIKLVEDEIAAVLSGETEVLKEHQVLGIFPKPGVCMTSDVLRTLNDEATKTKAEKEQENRKWTTFLQRPDRPVPKSKAQIEAEKRAANAYKVKIVKSRPKTPEPEPVKPVEPILDWPPPVPPKEPTPEPAEEELPTPADSEVPNLEEAPVVETAENNAAEAEEIEKVDKEKEASPETTKSIDDDEELRILTIAPIEEKDEITANSSSDDNKTAANKCSSEKIEREKTEEELALERQLADVQQQLAALSTLPSTIQATLDAVTRQLATLLPTLKQQQQQETTTIAKTSSNATIGVALEKIDENAEENDASDNGVHQMLTDATATEGNVMAETAISTNEANVDERAQEIKSGQPAENGDETLPEDGHKKSCAENQQMEDELNIKKQKKYDVIEELEEHLEAKTNSKGKRSKRAFGPLTPSSERPLVLPGGRRWYRPKDAYNDEFIAETLSAQAELITGHTLGGTFESPLLGYDSRVNFMKYQKPERKIDLNRSEVYKVIHHLDRQPLHGIEVRPPVVPAAADIKTTLDA